MSLLDKLGGFLTGGLGEKIAGIIDKRIPDRDLATKLQHEITVMLSTQQHEIAKLALEVERDAEANFQQTVQAELGQSDVYTKQTRPKIARQSWYGVLGYVAVSLVSALVVAIPDVPIDWTILTVLASPVLTYMGVRTFDKWKIGK